MQRFMAFLVGLALVAQSGVGAAQPRTTPAPQGEPQPQTAQQEGTGQQVAYGAGSVLGTLVHSPVKASFCILGAISSGFAYPIAGSRTAGNIVGSTCGGTWAITPDALKGKERGRFVGNSPS
jgi:hypothetical protein